MTPRRTGGLVCPPGAGGKEDRSEGNQHPKPHAHVEVRLPDAEAGAALTGWSMGKVIASSPWDWGKRSWLGALAAPVPLLTSHVPAKMQHLTGPPLSVSFRRSSLCAAGGRSLAETKPFLFSLPWSGWEHQHPLPLLFCWAPGGHVRSRSFFLLLCRWPNPSRVHVFSSTCPGTVDAFQSAAGSYLI